MNADAGTNRPAARPRVCMALLVVVVCGLAWFSLHLARTRLYQVDECQNVSVAHFLLTGQIKTAYANLTLLDFPLAWLSRGVLRAADLFEGARFLMLEIFWLNLVLIALATGQKLLSRRGLIALVAAATLAPLWDYGFEVRHDNLLLTGVLLLWCVVRVRPAGVQSFMLAGALAVALQFVAFKAFVYTLPITLAVFAFPPPGHKATRGKLILAWAAGALAILLVLRVAYGAAGLWDLFLSDLRRVQGDATGDNRFGPWQTLARLLGQTPLLLALVVAGLISLALDLRRRGKPALTWDSSLPEALLFAVALAALLINPAPYPYNLLHLVPYAFLFAFRYADSLWSELRLQRALVPAAGAVLLFAHFVPFAVATRRHLDWPNTRQVGIMSLAEDLTDPVKDPVYDGVGLVPTRPRVHFKWYLHSLNIQGFVKGSGPRVREMLAANPAAVFIPSYRTDWLPDDDHAFIREWYVPLADDFWVLGKVLPPGGGAFQVIHPGRYRLAAQSGSDLEGTYPDGWAGILVKAGEGNITGTLDGISFSNRPVELTVGTHHLETGASVQPVVEWVGPSRERLPRLGRGDHRRLFANWY